MRELIAGYLVNAAWQTPVVLICALLVSRAAGPSPGLRSRLWLGFLAAAALLPALSLKAILPAAVPTVARVAPTAFVDAPAASVASASEPALQLEPWTVWLMVGLGTLAALIVIARLIAA